MIAFGHTAIGSDIGLIGYSLFKTTSPLIGLPATGVLGVASHYLMDLMPHGHFFHPSSFKKNLALVITLDLIFSILLFLGVAFFQSGWSIKLFYILFGIGGSQLPDVLDSLIRLKALPKKGFLKYEFNFHSSTHWHGKEEHSLLISKLDIWQLLVVVFSLYLLSLV